MKNLAIRILVTFIIVFIILVVFAIFISWDIKISDWSPEGRFLVVCMSFLLTGGYIISTLDDYEPY